MKVIWAHDNYFIKGEGDTVYSEVEFPYSNWQRYLEGFDEVIVTSRISKFPASSFTKKLNLSSGPNVSFVEIPSLSGVVNQITKLTEAKSKLEEAITNADALIARLPSEIGVLSIRVAERLGKPWAVELVGCPWDAYWNHGSWQGKIYAGYAKLITKNLMKKARYAMYVTDHFLQKRYPTKAQTIACSNVNLSEVNERILKRKIERSSNQTKLNIGLIGYLFKNKGIDTALHAIKLANDQLPSYEFRILGGGNPQKWIDMTKKLGLEKRVVFYDTLPSGEAVHRWLDEIDLYIQPSRSEGLPRTLIEAMSRGCPAIGSTAGGIPELLHHSCIHRPGDEIELSKLIIKAANDKKWLIEQADQNFNKAKKYEQKVLAKKREEFWIRFSDDVKIAYIDLNY